MLTHDPVEARRYADDPLISRQIAVKILVELFDTAARVLAGAAAIRVPTLVLAAGSDCVVRRAPQLLFFNGLSSRFKRFRELSGLSHAIFHDTGREDVFVAVRTFLCDGFEMQDAQLSLLSADEHGHSRNAFDRLHEPLPIVSLRRLNLSVQRLFMKSIGRLSKGIRIGWRRRI